MKRRITFLIYLTFGLNFLQLFSTTKGDVSCNRNYDGTSGVGVIESPNYPFDYDNDQTCIYRIYIDKQGLEPGTKKVCFTFERFRLDIIDYLLVDQKGFHGNGTGPYNTTIWKEVCQTLSESDVVDLQFISDSQFVSTGFRARFEILPVQVTNPGSNACTNNEWRCLDGTCISQEKVCDNNNDCKKLEDESYAHARCDRNNLLISGMVACDYSSVSDQSCRQWSTWKTGWKKEIGTTHPLYGPSKDHTGGDSVGFYLRTNFQWDHPKTFNYVIEIGSLLDDAPYCLSFYYHMRGKDPGVLMVFWGATDHSQVPYWSRKGNHGDQWHHGHIERTTFVKNEDPHFEVKRGGEIDSQIALDDISVMKGSCNNIDDISCNFEGTFCGWTTRGAWALENAAETGREEPPYDSSARRAKGEFARLEGSTGTLKSPTVTSSYNHDSCFALHLSYTQAKWSDRATVQFKLVPKNKETILVCTSSFGPTDDWAQFTCSIPPVNRPYQIEVSLSYFYGTLLIDEVSLIHLPCSQLDLKTCLPNEFRCQDKDLDTCIPAYLKCNGEEDCEDGSDEQDCPNPGRCESQEFMCANGMCIPSSYKCNGHDDCGDGSDEQDCSPPDHPGSFLGSFTVAAVASIIAACILLIVIIFAKVFMCYYKRRPRRPPNFSNGIFHRRDSHDSTMAQPPPAYDQCADNLATYPKPKCDLKEGDEPELPTYDLVQKEQYVQITVPIEDEVRRMKEAMATRNNSLASTESEASESIVAVPQYPPPITGAAALMNGGSLAPAPVVSWEPAVHRLPGRSYRMMGHVNRGFSGSDTGLNLDREDETRSPKSDLYYRGISTA